MASSKKPNKQLSERAGTSAALAQWMIAEHFRIHGIRRISNSEREAIENRAAEIIRHANKKKTLRVLEKGGRKIAVATIHPSAQPRIPRQQALFFLYDRRLRKQAAPWVKRTAGELARLAPRYTQIGIDPSDESLVRRPLQNSGFATRYEILVGDTKTALKNLKKQKSPPRDLEHLGLRLERLSAKTQLAAVMRFQRQVSLESKRHIYFSHTKAQLKKDEEEYCRILTGKQGGQILGVYRGEKLLGLMVTSVHGEGKARHGGFSFFLHPSIRGLGITKTGYLLLLEYLDKEKVRTFHGGTSQPAIQSLGKIMKRVVQHLIFVKM